MNFLGRWVPMEVMNAILLLWVISVVIVSALIWWLNRKAPPANPREKTPARARRRRRSHPKT